MSECQDNHRYWPSFESLPHDQGDIAGTSVQAVRIKKGFKMVKNEGADFVRSGQPSGEPSWSLDIRAPRSLCTGLSRRSSQILQNVDLRMICVEGLVPPAICGPHIRRKLIRISADGVRCDGLALPHLSNLKNRELNAFPYTRISVSVS